MSSTPTTSTTTSRPMGKIITSLTVTNRADQVLAARGVIPADAVRSVTLDNVLADSGATSLCLPREIVAQLGLEFIREVRMSTAAGRRRARIFRDASVTLLGREDTFTCLELPSGTQPLIGVVPLEALGIELDLRNQQLRLLPEEGDDTHFTA